MTEEVIEKDQTAVTGNETALESEAAPKLDAEGKPVVSGAQETAVETDEQKNERVQREAKEASEKRARGVQKRMDELTADKYAERKRADELAQQNARILALLEAKAAPQTQQTTGAPTREQFDSYEDFLRADAKYVAQQEAKTLIDQATKANQEQTQRQSAQQAENELERKWQASQKEFAAKTPDYAEKMENADVPIPTPVFTMMKRMGAEGAAVAYAMVNNPDLAQQFFQQPPEMHGILLGQISATLKGATKSNAPAPGKPARSTTGTSDGPPSDPELYYAWAQKNLK